MEYIHQVWCIEQLKDAGLLGVYGMERHRIELHEQLCKLLAIDHVKSKEILSYLDEKIGVDFFDTPSDSELRNYGQKLLDLLLTQELNPEN
jgi:hypothetical protein